MELWSPPHRQPLRAPRLPTSRATAMCLRWAHSKRPWASLKPATEPLPQGRDAVVVALGGILPTGPEAGSDPAPPSRAPRKRGGRTLPPRGGADATQGAPHAEQPLSLSMTCEKRYVMCVKQTSRHNWCVSGHASHRCPAMARGPKPAGGHLTLVGSTAGCAAPQTVPGADASS